MELTILGSGTCVPSAQRGSPANFLKIGSTNILVDCGPGTLRQVKKARLDYKDIDYVFLTHFHSDHIADLVPLLQALNWTPGFDRKKHLTIIGPVGLLEFYKTLLQLFPGAHPRRNTYEINVIEMLPGAHTFTGGFCVKTLKTIHCKESIAYKFEAEDKKVVVSGDCGYNLDLAEFAKNADIFVLECSFLRGFPDGHLNVGQCGAIASLACPKKLVLTHLYPPFSESERMEEVKSFFEDTATNATIVAEDLMRIRI